MILPMKRILLFAASAFMFEYAEAQDIPSKFDLQNKFFVYNNADLSAADSTVPSPPKQRLLPSNVSFMENWLWGENGAMRNIGVVAPLTPEERKKELTLRRTMLTTHQIGGFVTLAMMGSAVYFGQRIIDGHRGDRGNHQLFVTATIITYSATGLLAILSPPPLIRRDESSTTTTHKTLAWVHVAGMILTPILGGMINKRSHSISETERFHQYSGYITTATFAASMIVVTF